MLNVSAGDFERVTWANAMNLLVTRQRTARCPPKSGRDAAAAAFGPHGPSAELLWVVERQ